MIHQMTHIFSIYGGLHYRKITNVEISTGEGIKANRNTVDLYADIMLAPVVPISNVIDNEGKEVTLETDLPESESKKKTYMIKDTTGQLQTKSRE